MLLPLMTTFSGYILQKTTVPEHIHSPQQVSGFAPCSFAAPQTYLFKEGDHDGLVGLRYTKAQPLALQEKRLEKEKPQFGGLVGQQNRGRYYLSYRFVLNYGLQPLDDEKLESLFPALSSRHG